jgi:hydrogenase-4 component B
MSEQLVLWGILLAAVSGVPGLFVSRRSHVGQWLSVLLAVAAGALGLAGVASFWITGISQPLVEAWPQIQGAEFRVAMDGLSAFFLIPVFLVFVLGSVYGLEYWRQSEHTDNGRKLRLFYGLMAAGMGLLVISRNSILFLMGWEAMALAGFFLVSTEDDRADARAAGWIYLLATHVATLSLFGMFALLRLASGSFTFGPLADGTVSPTLATGIFVLACVGFGLKAGIMPLHVWLPSAHAIAPSHVSAFLSGVIIKMGIYGIVRVTSFFAHPPVEWGGILLALGAISGVLGVAFAIGQHDLKRLLAYHSIENIGIIIMGVGLAVLGRSLQRDDWLILGLAGGLLHVWNHAFFKGLLFLSAGSVIHQVHTREIDHLGGLAKSMPLTALAFVIGAVAICGLPPLNGFVSEFLVYLGLFKSLGAADTPSPFPAAAFAAPALALIGALAVACFVKVFGAVFLGVPRSQHAEHAQESGASMLLPMAVLVACCAFIGVAPSLVVPVLGQAVSAWAPEVSDVGPRLVTLAPLGWVSAMALGLVVALALIGVWLAVRTRGTQSEYGPTWGCGYLAPTSRMQYTSSSFAQMLVGLFGWALRPRVHRPDALEIFPQKTSFHSEVPDTVLDEAVLPTLTYSARVLAWFRVFQQGSIQTYLLYLFLALFALFLWR